MCTCDSGEHSNLAGVNLLGRRKSTPGDADDDAGAMVSLAEEPGVRGTAPKGKPTPKRSDAARKRGPVAPAPMTTAEARARRKAIAGPKLSREERREARTLRRERMNERREKMMSGDEDYLLARDQGPVRRFARDVVDSRRNLLGLFMPLALGVVFFGMALPMYQFYVYPAMMLVMAAMLIDALLLGRKVNRLADAKFPDNTESHWKLGFYAAGRASQLRRTRAPRPRVKLGDPVG